MTPLSPNPDLCLGLEPVARAMAEFSSDMPWAQRHPKNRAHWLAVAEVVMGLEPGDEAFDSIMERVKALKAART